MKKFWWVSFISIIGILIACSGGFKYPETAKVPVTNDYHGTEITDNYRWLEDGTAPEVVSWVAAQEKLTHKMIDHLPQKQWLIDHYNELLRVDEEGVPRSLPDGGRMFKYVKAADQDKWVYNTKSDGNAAWKVLIDPNSWEEIETLAGPVPSRDGKYLAYGVAHGGDENSIYRVMDIETGEQLPDSLLGWKQYVTSWLPDNSGFYYSAKPLAGDVPEGEEYYWPSAYFHELGTPASGDRKVFSDDSVKEYWHNVSISENGRWEVYDRSLFNVNEVYLKPVGSQQELIPLATGMDAEYSVDIVDNQILIKTDAAAPLFKVYVTDAKKPQRKYWQEFIPEHEKDKLKSINPIGGHIYALYEHNAYSVIRIYDLKGNYLRDIGLPMIGSVSVSGLWSKPDVWVTFQSYAYPKTIFRYNFDKDELEEYWRYPVDIPFEDFVTEQVWYPSKDGTQISMFLVKHKDTNKNRANPVYLTGYGGFNISESPYFSSTYLAWLKAGGLIAVPNLRGGGEYGRAWHEAGMLEKKQNVFDDFIAAAEWLISEHYTNREKIAIVGGSNGGLLVGAFAVQRPELCKAVYCAVPLLDMVNYHTFGLANIWSEEYGSSDDPEQFKYIYAYSPYHHVVDGTDYPAMLITGSDNDARVDPLHARKMVARLQEADPQGEPILLLQRKASGHGGGTTLSTVIEQRAEVYAFLMDQLGMIPSG